MTDETQRQLDKVFRHIEIYNREMGQVQSDISNIKNEVKDIKSTLKIFEGKLDKAINSLPLWATMFIGVLMAIIGYLANHLLSHFI